MFKPVFNKTTFNEQEERDKLNKLSEKELLIEAILEMKKISRKCDNISRKIVVWSDLKVIER